MTTTNCSSVNPTLVESLFHWNQNPEDRTETCSERQTDLASKNVDPSSILAFFVNLLTDYFSDPNSIVDDGIRTLIQTKPIIISALTAFDTDVAGSKPCIYVEYGGKKSQENFAFNNQFGYNPANGSKLYYTRWQMGFTFYIIGNTLQETLNLSEEVCKLLHCYQQPIEDTMQWVRFQLAEVQKVQSTESGDGFVSSVSATIVVNYPWYIFDSAPKLKRVIMRVRHSAGLNELDSDD